MTADPITRLTVELQGATQAELHRGLEAALRVFKGAGVTPLQVARALHALERWDTASGAPENRPPRGTARTAAVWDAAAAAATLACTQGWTRPAPERATLNLEYAADETDD